MNWQTYTDKCNYSKNKLEDWSELYNTLTDTISTWGNPDYSGMSHDDWWKTVKFDKNEKVTYNNSVEKKEEK